MVSNVDRKDDDPMSRSLRQLKTLRGANAAAVALAKKNARIIWDLLAKGTNYQPGYVY
jgi:transposase